MEYLLYLRFQASRGQTLRSFSITVPTTIPHPSKQYINAYLEMIPIPTEKNHPDWTWECFHGRFKQEITKTPKCMSWDKVQTYKYCFVFVFGEQKTFYFPFNLFIKWLLGKSLCSS